MKKLLKVILASMLCISLFGCTSKKSYVYRIENNNQKYAMISDKGEKITDFAYDRITFAGDTGFILKNSDGCGYMDLFGEWVIKQGTYSAMVYRCGYICAKKNDQFVILDTEGKVIYEDDDNHIVNLVGLPVVRTGDYYSVVYNGYDNFISSAEEILEAKEVSGYVFAKSADSLYVQEIAQDSTLVTLKNLSADYELVDAGEDTGFLFIDRNAGKIAYVTSAGKLEFEKEIEIDQENPCTASFDKNGNITVDFDDRLMIISKTGNTTVNCESYYKDTKNYIIRNDKSVYGPQTFICNGKEIEVKNIQVSPDIEYQETIFPVYVKDKGYEFYSYDGKALDETVYTSASSFNGKVAIVSNTKGYYLMDEEGKLVNKSAYKKIEAINSKYYKAYLDDNKYQVIDYNGKTVIDEEFSGSAKYVRDSNNKYLILSKNGTSYVYNYDFDVVLSKEGTIELKDHMFVVNGNDYYTQEGNEIYKL